MGQSSNEDKNPFGDNRFGRFVDNYLGYASQVLTGGLVHYNKGKFDEGITTRGIKNVTGATAAEEANQLARQQFEQTKYDAANARVEAQKKNYQNQLQASRSAAGIRATAAAQTNTDQTSNLNKLGGAEKDFLGL